MWVLLWPWSLHVGLHAFVVLHCRCGVMLGPWRRYSHKARCTISLLRRDECEGNNLSHHVMLLSRLRCTKCPLVAAKYNGTCMHVLSHDKMAHVHAYWTVNCSSHRDLPCDSPVAKFFRSESLDLVAHRVAEVILCIGLHVTWFVMSVGTTQNTIKTIGLFMCHWGWSGLHSPQAVFCIQSWSISLASQTSLQMSF